MQGNLSALSSYIDHFKLFFWFGKQRIFFGISPQQTTLVNKQRVVIPRSLTLLSYYNASVRTVISLLIEKHNKQIKFILR